MKKVENLHILYEDVSRRGETKKRQFTENFQLAHQIHILQPGE